MDTQPSIEIFGLHVGKCVQCQDAAKEALAGNQSFWDEEIWATFCCLVGKQLRIDVIQELS